MTRSIAEWGRRLPRLWGHLKRLHADQRGAQGLELLLIIAAIALPLLGVLIWFRNDIMEWVKDVWDKARGKGEEVDVEDPFGPST